jgi:hypothetical protein
MWYNHINFTAKAKGVVYSEVFFAEVISMQGEVLPVSCLCVIKSTDYGNLYSYLNSLDVEIEFVGGATVRCIR